MAWWFSNFFFFAYFAKYIPDESFNSGGAISYINSSDQIVAHGLKSKKKPAWNYIRDKFHTYTNTVYEVWPIIKWSTYIA